MPLDILRSHAEAYVRAAHALTLISHLIDEHNREQSDVRRDKPLLNRLEQNLLSLHEHCEHLPMTAKAIMNLVVTIRSPKMLAKWTQTEMTLLQSIAEIQGRLEDELSLSLFFLLPIERKKYFDKPLEGWQEVIARFPRAAADVEEMSKCFALSRYTACVFHSVSAIEAGLLDLGKFLGVTDPQSGWTAITKELERIVVKTKYGDRSPLHQQHYAFLEQMYGVAESLKSAWRNKVSHTQGKPILMTNDFSPDVAEEIMMASRSFMRRLATELPGGYQMP